MDFWNYLQQVGSLVDDFKGKKTVSVFFLDKDVDDLRNVCKTSLHVVYTRFYNIENHITAHGDLVGAVAAATLLDHASVREAFKAGNDVWRREAAEYWRQWVKLCVFTRIRELRHECNYGVHCSRINNGAYAPVDPVEFAARVATLERVSGLTKTGFKRVYKRVTAMVDDLYTKGRHDEVFNGKWYSLFLAEYAAAIAKERPYNHNGLSDRILSCLLLNLNMSEPWATHFRQPLENLIEKLI